MQLAGASARWQGLEARPKGKSSPQSSRRGRWAGSIELPHTWSGGTSGLAARSPTDACLLSKPTRLHRRVVCQRHAGTPTSRARSAVIGVETAYRAHRERRVVLPRGILLEDGVRAAPDRMGWISGAITWVLGLLSQELASVWEIHARRSTSVEKLFAEQAHGRAGLTRASG